MTNQEFFSLIKFVSSAAAVKEVRYYLNGVLLDFQSDKIVFVGTDGHRMAIVSDSHDTGFTGQHIVSNDSIKKLTTLFSKFAGDVDISVSEKELIINGIPATMVDGKFPDYTRIDVKSPDKTGARETVGFKPDYLVDAAKAFAILDKKLAVKIDLQDSNSPMLLSSSDEKSDARIIIMPMRV